MAGDLGESAKVPLHNLRHASCTTCIMQAAQPASCKAAQPASCKAAQPASCKLHNLHHASCTTCIIQAAQPASCKLHNLHHASCTTQPASCKLHSTICVLQAAQHNLRLVPKPVEAAAEAVLHLMIGFGRWATQLQLDPQTPLKPSSVYCLSSCAAC